MRCKTCRYPLTNLPEPRCPECGRAFDPDVPGTFETDASARERTHRRAFRWLTSCFVGSFAAALVLSLLNTGKLGGNATAHAALLCTAFATPFVLVLLLLWLSKTVGDHL